MLDSVDFDDLSVDSLVFGLMGGSGAQVAVLLLAILLLFH